jgi:hypothetical protein
MANSKTEPSCFATIIGLLVTLGFLGAGGYWLYHLYLQPQWELSASQTWPAIPCNVTVARWEQTEKKSVKEYTPVVEYTYQINNQSYNSTRLWFGSKSTLDKAAAENAIALFDAGGNFECYADPSHPSESVLIRKYNPVIGYGVIISMIAIGIGIMMLASHLFSALSAMFKGASGKSTSETNRDRAMSNPTCPIESGEPDEPLVVQAAESRVAVAIGLWVGGLFWNGVVWMIALGVGRQNDWIPFIFFLLFSLIGIAILVFAFYCTLQIFNPQPILVCSQRDIYPGSEFELSWMFRGNCRRIQFLEITLEGIEEVRYRQGTDTRTEKKAFFEQKVIASGEQDSIASGYQLVSIPVATMHSFKSVNNSFTWQIHVRGKIAFWPDILDRFEIVVLAPLAKATT